MSETEPVKKFDQQRGKFLLSLAINGVVPLILYALLRPLVASDTTALAVSGAIPLLWTLVQWLRCRRINWINGTSVLGFGIALGISILTGCRRTAPSFVTTVTADSDLTT